MSSRKIRIYLKKKFLPFSKLFINEDFKLIGILTLASVTLGVTGYMYFEELHKPGFNFMEKLEEAIWWAFTTMTTVGYGDQVPITLGGRLVGVFMMFSGVSILALISATLASMLVERKLNIQKGFMRVKMIDHIIIAGWNANGDKVLTNLQISRLKTNKSVAIVAEMEEAQIREIIESYPELQIRYVRGDCTTEAVLARANAAEAAMGILLCDHTYRGAEGRSDNRTVMTALAMRAISPTIKLFAELREKEYAPHLRNAGVNEIVISEEYTGYLLGNVALSPGVSNVVMDLLDFEGQMLRRVPVPAHLAGHSFKDVFDYFRKQFNAITVALLFEQEQLSLDDFLTDDTSFIDEFIKRQFEAAEIGTSRAKKGLHVLVNPADDYKVNNGDFAVVISDREIE